MKPFAQTCLHLFLLLSLALPPMLMTGCGGDRYACDTCGDTKIGNPDETDAEDLTKILPLSFIEAAEFTVDNTLDINNFDNYYNVDYRISTISDARETKYNKDDDPANIAGISAEFWDDQIETLTWDLATSDLADNKQRQYYRLDTDGWTLITERNKHELRRYDEKVYDFWLGATLKWEIYEAKDRTNPDNIAYPSIAGKQMDEVLLRPEFIPPILEDPIALESALLWGKNIPFSNTANAEAKIFVVYKQYRPITVKGDTDTAITDPSKGFYAFVPAPANAAGTAFEFQPLSSTTYPLTFRSEFTGLDSTARFQINNTLWISFNSSGAEGASGQGVILWSSKTTEFPDGFADYYEVATTNGSYIRIDIPMEQKATYKLETYENPLIAFIENIESDGTDNIGAHLGWYYVPSGTLDEDKPQPHYAFNGPAVSDLKSAFDTWRRQQYCDDNDHNDDPGRTAVCSSIGL